MNDLNILDAMKERLLSVEPPIGHAIRAVHTAGGTPYRKNYAGIGSTYDPVADVFYSPKPDENSILNPETYLWELGPSITQNTEE